MSNRFSTLGIGLLAVYASLVYACDEPAAKLLESNLRKWVDAGWTQYSFVVERQCFCPPEYRKPTRVFVNNGAVVRASFVEEAHTAVPAKVVADLATIEDWFSIIRNAEERQADRLAVVYHPEFGFPEKIEIDMRVRRADDEQSVIISEVVRQ